MSAAGDEGIAGKYSCSQMQLWSSAAHHSCGRHASR